MSHSVTDLRGRKARETKARIAAAAARLVVKEGLAAATIDRITDSAGVARATFFRYFSSKEDAVAEGMTAPFVEMIAKALSRQDPDLSAMDAMVLAFDEMAAEFKSIDDVVLELARHSRSSPALSAWTLQVYLRYEAAIAVLVAPRFVDLTAGDPRPRLVGAHTMAALRIALDDWVEDGGDLAALMKRALRSASFPVSTDTLATSL